MNKKTFVIIIVLALMLIGIFGYIQTTKEPKTPEKKLSPVLNVYNWLDYINPTVLEDFENEFGVKVNLKEYDDDEIMLSAVQSDSSEYDVIIGSDKTIRTMIAMKLLAPIDMENIPNFKNIGDNFRNPPYDPGNKYSVSYMWGTTGIAVNRKYTTEDVDSWGILWNPKYKGKMAMLNSRREVIGAALKYLGYSANSINPAELEEAKKILLEQKPLLRGYEETISMRDDLTSEELWVSHIYNGDAIYAASMNENIEYMIPKEGAILWVDNLVISRDSKNKHIAEVFINFILNPKVSADIANYVYFANTNEAAREFTDPQILEDPGIYPPQEVLDRCEFIVAIDEIEVIYNQIWAELQSSE